MSATEVQAAPTPALPDYLSDPNAVLKDASEWRYGKAPDYSKTRTVFEQSELGPSRLISISVLTIFYKAKKFNHEASSLPSLVENLVKNWEIEASFKPQLSDWRTVDRPNYSFAINGGPPQTAEHMLKVGTYNAIIAPNEFYSPAASDFTSSHKTFKRMMPTFAWEVVEVYSGPPQVAFRWRHWGEMKNDYVGFNEFGDPNPAILFQLRRQQWFGLGLILCSKGEKITAKAHNGPIDIEGVTVAQVDDQVRLQKVETWFDPLEMFRQIAPNGIVNKEVREQHPTGDNNDQMENSAEENAESQSSGKPTSTAQTKIDSGPSDLSVPNVAPSQEKLDVTSSDTKAHVEKHDEIAENDKFPTQVNEDSNLPPFDTDPPIEFKPQTKDPEDGDGPEFREAKPRAVTNGVPQLYPPTTDTLATGIQPRSKDDAGSIESQPPSNVSLNQILKGLESMQADFRQLSARVGDFEARISRLDGVPSKDIETALSPGNAVAASPQDEETQRTHEEMSRISAGECPFLMNRE